MSLAKRMQDVLQITAIELITAINHYHINIFYLGRVFANDPGDLGSIPGRVIPKTLKMVLDTFLLITQQYKARIKSKAEQSRKGVVPFPTPRYSSY